MYSVLNAPSEHTFTHQKTLLHVLLLLVFKIVRSLHCIHNKIAGFQVNDCVINVYNYRSILLIQNYHDVQEIRFL